MENTFGQFIKRLRTERRVTLRGFCEAAGVDPANHSKVERGLLPPPRDPEKLDAYVSALGLTASGAESRELRRLAALDRGEVPPAILADNELVGKLPALFRTLEGDPVDPSLLDDLIDTIRRE